MNDGAGAAVHAAFIERDCGFLKSKNLSSGEILTEDFGGVEKVGLFRAAGGEFQLRRSEGFEDAKSASYQRVQHVCVNDRAHIRE